MTDTVTVISQILRSLISSDNVLRSKAEETLQNEFIQVQPESTFLALTHILMKDPEIHVLISI
ncbi:hypothetical protein HMI54_001858 [Coelomomyces lativittatus]|nr:hypothetical protein HMI55_002158 [Coelomomyces lativittatus]KAJ1510111.1 hypothetical protein HMI54_001858 [Coelomomyces lativittatus]KAJ1512428.1 hypothetical protein HMI56_004069 [Coelomomyces lativittatus]